MFGADPDSPFSLNLGQSAFSQGEEQERAAGFNFFSLNGGESRGDFSLFGQADTEGGGLEENNFSFSLNGGNNFVSAFDTNSDKPFFWRKAVVMFPYTYVIKVKEKFCDLSI